MNARHFILAGFLLALALFPSIHGMEIGTNLGFQIAYEPEWKFKDIFEHSRPFNLPGREFGGIGSGCLDADQWPTQSPCNGQTAQTTIFEAGNWNQTPEAYQLKLEGSGSMTLTGGASGTYSAPGTYNVQVTSSGAVNISFTSNASDPLRNVDFVPAQFFSDYKTDPLYPVFVSRLTENGGVKVLRFMDPLETNYSPNILWSGRRTPSGQQQSGSRGLAMEYIPLISNAINASPWVNIPHGADDNYIHEFAKVLKQNLSSDKNIYIEYSNEVWNSLFTSQYNYAYDQGIARGYPMQFARMMYVVARSFEIQDIFRQEFAGEEDRLKTVLAWQATQSSQSDQLLSYMSNPTTNPKNLKADYFAVGLYFGIATKYIYQYNLESSITQDQLFEILDQALTEDTISIPGVITYANIPLTKRITDNKALADKYGLKLAGYEGGLSLVAYQAGGIASSRIDTLTAKYVSINQDSRMEGIYDESFDLLEAGGIDLFNHYKFVGHGDKYGLWGALEWQDQDPNGSPLAPRWISFSAHLDDSSSPPAPPGCIDSDGDSYFVYDANYCQSGNDCDDASSTIHPGAIDFCEDGVDQDCSGDDLSCIEEPADDSNASSDSNDSSSTPPEDTDSTDSNTDSESDSDTSPVPSSDVNYESKSVCGDGICSENETAASCEVDCLTFRKGTCGNETCENFETIKNCPADCGRCGDNICTSLENPFTCSKDCPIQENFLPTVLIILAIIGVILAIAWIAMTKKPEE